MGNGATEFTLVIEAGGHRWLTGRVKKSRRFIQGGGLDYYVMGHTGSNWGYWANVVLHHAMEQGRRALEMRRWL